MCLSISITIIIYINNLFMTIKKVNLLYTWFNERECTARQPKPVVAGHSSPPLYTSTNCLLYAERRYNIIMIVRKFQYTCTVALRFLVEPGTVLILLRYSF